MNRFTRQRYRGLDMNCPVEWNHPLNKGLVGCWMVPPNPGWRGGKLRDLIRPKKTNDGTFVSSPQMRGPSGRRGGFGSVSYSSTDQSYTSISVPVVIAYPFTVTCWFRPASVGTTRWLGCISDTGSEDNHWDWGMLSDSTIFVETKAAGSTDIGVTSTTVAAGTWYFGSWVYASATDRRVYLNLGGVGSSTSNLTPASLDVTRIAALERTVVFTSNTWDGLIDDVRIWKFALSVSEMTAVRNQSLIGYPDMMRWLSPRTFFLSEAPPATPASFNAAWASQSNILLGNGTYY